MNPIRHADPGAGYFAHKAEIDAAVARALDSGWYILGAEVSAFEREWAGYISVEHAVGVGNGTDAIELALRALDIGNGDTVLTTSNTAVATVAAIELSGASALLVDVDEATLTLSPERLNHALSDNPGGVKAVIPVHLYGHPAAMTEILEICEKHRLFVIEDCAQAHGASIDGRRVGTFGDAAAFSFYPTKNLAALGDGGAVVTRNSALADKIRELRVYGWRDRYISESAGMNTRLDEIQAAILRVRLGHLESGNARRRAIAQSYDRSLADTSVSTPYCSPNAHHVYHQYVIRSSRRDALRAHLKEQQIETAVLYPVPIHQQPGYRGRVAIAGELTITEQAARELLCLPMHPWVSDDEVARVISAIRDFC